MRFCSKKKEIERKRRNVAMRLMKTGVIVFAVVFISLALFFSCDNGTKGVDPTEADIQKFVEAMSIFGFVLGDGELPCINFSESEPWDPEGGTITFTGCEFDGVTVNGSVNLKMAYNAPIFSITLSGTLNFSGAGAPASSMAFNFTLTLDESSYPYEIAMSGTVTIDGTVFNASGFLDEFYNFFFYYYYY
jgi:hypothetical protein